MAEPTFDGITLCTRAGRCEIDAPRVRAWSETLPGVNGEFLQLGGVGGRRMRISGLLGAAGATAPAARSALLAAIRQRQTLADGARVASLYGTDAHVYDDCVLRDYRHGPVRITRESDGSYSALAAVRAELLQVSP